MSNILARNQFVGIAAATLAVAIAITVAPARAGSNGLHNTERELMDGLSVSRRNAHQLGLDHTLANKKHRMRPQHYQNEFTNMVKG